jgi:hypothetical protein
MVGGICMPIDGSPAPDVKAKDAIANYYLAKWIVPANGGIWTMDKNPNTLGVGQTDKTVFHIHPSMTPSDFTENRVSMPALYVDPFDPFNGNVLKIRSTANPLVENVSLISESDMRKVKNGDWNISHGMTKSLNDGMYRCEGTGGICGLAKSICPSGMIAVKNADGSSVSCQSWVNKVQRNECTITSNQTINSILSGDGGTEISDDTKAMGRLGCLIGKSLNEVDGLSCGDSQGGSKVCRPGYELVAIFCDQGKATSTGCALNKLTFECKQIGNHGGTNCQGTISGGLAGGAGQVANCSAAYISPTLDNNINFPIPSYANKSNDAANIQCPHQIINAGVDEFGKPIPTIYRGTSMYIVGDCRVCF